MAQRTHPKRRRSLRYQVEGLERRLLLSSSPLLFGTQQTYGAGVDPASLAVADLNSDGKPDLLVGNFWGGTVSVLLGNGNGTFQAQQTLAAGLNPYSVVVADVNGDGRPDLLFVDSGSDTVNVCLGNGNGTFQQQQTFSTGSNPRSVAVADVNGDGWPDLVVANRGTNTLSVLLGNGDGTFRSQQTLQTGSQPASCAVLDINRDNKMDIVACNYGGNSVSVFLGNGNGSFALQQTFATDLGPRFVVASDLTGDGLPDVVTTNIFGGDASVLLGNGNGTFRAQRTFATGTLPYSVAVSDINGDGVPDLVVANDRAGTMSVLLGNGDGTFQAQLTFAAGTLPASVAVADVNGDGRLDLVVSNDGSGNSNAGYVGVMLNGVPGGIPAPTGVRATEGQYTDHVEVEWTAATGAQSYEVWRNTVNTTTSATELTGNVTNTYYQDNSATPGTDYYYWVVAVNGSTRNFSASTVGFASNTPGGSGTTQNISLSPLQLQGTFTISGDLSTATGTIQIGLASSSLFQALLTVTGTVSYDTKKITVNGSVDAEIGNLSLPILKGDFVIPIGEGDSSSVDDSAPSQTEEVAGLQIDIQQISLIAAPSGPEIDLQSEIQLPKPLNTSIDADVLITTRGIQLKSASVSFPDVAFALGPLNISAKSMSVSYDSTGELVLQGDLTLDGLIGDISADANFSGNGNGIFIQGNSVNAVGELSLSDLNIDGWGLQNATLDINTIKNIYSGSATLSIPGLPTVGASFALDAGQLDSLSVSVTNVNYPILDTGWFLDGIGGGVSNLVHGPITFSGFLDLSLGPDEQIELPSWLGGANADTALTTLDLNASITSTDIQGSATLKIADGLAVLTGSADLNLAAHSFNADGTLTAFDNVLTGNASIAISSTGATSVYAGGSLSIPSSDIPIIGSFPDQNITIASGNFYLNYVPGNASQDYVDLWGSTGLTSISVPFIQLPVGLQVGFSPSVSIHPLYANNLPAIPAAVGLNISAQANPTSTSMTFSVAAQTPWALLEAAWPNSVSNVPVEIQAPNGTIYTESQFSSTNGIGLIDQMSDSIHETVGISNPATGNWILIIPDTTGLGTVSFNAASATPVTGDHLVFVQKPANTTTGALLSPMVVAVEDQNGNVITGDGSTVTLSLIGGTQALDGTLAVAAVNGLTTFSNLMFIATGAYGLKASDGTDTPATSSSITIGDPVGLSAGAGAQYKITGPAGSQTLDVSAGIVTLGSDLSAELLNYTLKVEAGARVILDSNQHVGQLVLIGNGTLDTGVYSLVINYDGSANPIAAIRSCLATGYNGGAWNGSGISSSAAAANPGYALAYADGADGLTPGLSSGQIEIKYTLYGDTGLTGTVGFVDFMRMTQHYTASSGGSWDTGDFNYDGSVNFTDFTLMTQHYGQSANQIIGATHLQFVTQPTTAMAGSTLNAMTVYVEDQFGRVVTNDSSTVTLAVDSGPGALAGTVAVQAQNGVATFTNLTLDEGGDYTLHAIDGDLGVGVSSQFTIISTDVWTGQMSSDWNNPTNWNTGLLPGGATDVVINEGAVVAGTPLNVAAVALNGSILQLAAGTGTSNISSLTVNNAAMLDVGNNQLFINYGGRADPIAAIRTCLATGYNGGAWNGIGISSSAAASNAAQTTAIGYADSAEGLVAMPSDTIEVKYALYGDTGLGGTVGFTDFMRMTQHFTQNSGATWAEGDFNYDGSVNAADFALLQPNYGQTLPAPSSVSPLSPPAPPARPPRSVGLPPPSALVGSTVSQPPADGISLTINVSGITTTTYGDATQKRKPAKGRKSKILSVTTAPKNKRKSGNLAR